MPRYYNPTNGPVYFEDGASIGGGERLDRDETDRVVELVSGGYLEDITEPNEEPAPKSKAKKSSASDKDSQQSESDE